MLKFQLFQFGALWALSSSSCRERARFAHQRSRYARHIQCWGKPDIHMEGLTFEGGHRTVTCIQMDGWKEKLLRGDTGQRHSYKWTDGQPYFGGGKPDGDIQMNGRMDRQTNTHATLYC